MFATNSLDPKRATLPLKDLVFEENALVTSVNQTAYYHRKSDGEITNFGNSSSSAHLTGQSYQCVIGIKPRRNIPVREVVFDSASGVRVGDRVRLTIPRVSKSDNRFGEEDGRYCDRPYGPIEKAIRIQVLRNFSDNSPILRTEQSPDFSEYQ